MSAARERAALDLLDRDQIVELTSDLIRGRGENPGETEAETVRLLAAHCLSIGARVTLQEVSPGRSNLRAELGDPEGPVLLFLGHSDVVPAGAGWTGDPFEPRLEHGALIGRGATDMKGGLAAALAAMSALAVARPELRTELLCTVDEEDLATGVQAYIAETEPRDLLACVVAEPTDLRAVIGCRGATNLALSLTGASAHAGRPEDGASAILAAGVAIDTVHREHEAAQDTRDPLLGSPSWNIGTISGGSATSMVAQSCALSLDRRTLPGERAEDILAGLLERVRAGIAASGIAGAERIRLEGQVEMVMPGFRTDPDAQLARVACAVLDELGRDASPTGWTAACEGGFIAAHHGVPTIILGPGDITGQAHQPDEQVLISDLLTAAQTYALIGMRLGTGAETRTHSPATPPA